MGGGEAVKCYLNINNLYFSTTVVNDREAWLHKFSHIARWSGFTFSPDQVKILDENFVRVPDTLFAMLRYYCGN